MKIVPRKIPAAKPARPTTALRSPPARRRTMRSGQPKKASAPIMTKAPSTNRRAGEEPALAFHSFVAMAIRKLPRTRPMISGRTYCTLAAECRPTAPAISRSKQAMQKPMLAGLPSAVSTSAAMPMTTPVRMTNRFSFFMFSFLRYCRIDFDCFRYSGTRISKTQQIRAFQPVFVICYQE